MPSKELLNKLAKLAVRVGVNVQKGQHVVIRTSVEAKELTREVVEEAYLAGAKKVSVIWGDEVLGNKSMTHMTIDELINIPPWQIDQYKGYVEDGSCFISITSPMPGLNKDIDPKKSQAVGMAMQKALSFFSKHTMGNKTQWTIIGASNPVWAKIVFPELEEEAAVEKLWDAIFDASRVRLETDPIEEWNTHNENLLKHNILLNNYNFKHLHFKNSLGTDLIVELVENHLWAGGGETGANGVYFNPNIPSEETFTMPYKYGTRGRVYSTKPLNYQGKLIEDFWLEFKDGKVIDFDAKKEKATLENLLNLDEGSRYIGEIALISHDSPISNTNILFFNTLFDENASCHMALGRAYPLNIKGGLNMSIEELKEKGYNDSLNHADFMFGSYDMEITGLTYDGKEIKVFEKGNFVI